MVAHLYFFSTHRPTLEKSKRATKPKHQDTANMDRHSINGRRSTTGNSGFKKLAVQWLIEHLCFVSSVVLADSFVLRNPQLLKPAKTSGCELTTLPPPSILNFQINKAVGGITGDLSNPDFRAENVKWKNGRA